MACTSMIIDVILAHNIIIKVMNLYSRSYAMYHTLYTASRVTNVTNYI